MLLRYCLHFTLVLICCTSLATAGTVVQDLLAGYESIETVSCEVRKTNESADGRMDTLSRVHYAHPWRLHVENSAPRKRRIIADGTTFFSYTEGQTCGFSRPVTNLILEMRIGLERVPGTAMEHLLRFRDAPETPLEPTAEFPTRRGYATTSRYAVVSLDATGRLARIEFYRAADMKEKLAEANYSQFLQATSGVWLAQMHKTTATLGGVESQETSQFINLQVNQPVAPALFEAAPFFKDVTFVDEFAKIEEK